jgi:two-component system response regulator
VEDNASDVELALRAFKKNKLINRIQVVRDGEEALDYLFCKGNYASRDINQVPKLIIMDLNMPKVNGIELLRQIKSVSHTRDIPVIVLTSSQEEQDIMETYRLGISSYMLKPVNFDQFVDSVRQIGFRWMLLPPESPAE